VGVAEINLNDFSKSLGDPQTGNNLSREIEDAMHLSGDLPKVIGMKDTNDKQDYVFVEDHFGRNTNSKRDPSDSMIGVRESTDLSMIKKTERRGTILDVYTNDATLFNLGYTARITQVPLVDGSVRKTSVLAPNMFSSSMLQAMTGSQVAGMSNSLLEAARLSEVNNNFGRLSTRGPDVAIIEDEEQ